MKTRSQNRHWRQPVSEDANCDFMIVEVKGRPSYSQFIFVVWEHSEKTQDIFRFLILCKMCLEHDLVPEILVQGQHLAQVLHSSCVVCNLLYCKRGRTLVQLGSALLDSAPVGSERNSPTSAHLIEPHCALSVLLPTCPSIGPHGKNCKLHIETQKFPWRTLHVAGSHGCRLGIALVVLQLVPLAHSFRMHHDGDNTATKKRFAFSVSTSVSHL
ncbi:hypothetical protein PR048_015537 [Dryococelus australis]|uniref:Uncharacterized protein n=1 Tax=Dryococelus australis TaxID=614101 RepID=A0ABQ9HH81_9NEOP|nr:hypothetical protein PR048_015537 [Dryococelus australis]